MHIIKLIFIFSILLCNSVLADSPQVEIKTNFGSILLELYPEKAPRTVKNFLSYVQKNYYSNTVFHRVIPGFMIQGGGYNKSLKEMDTYDKPSRVSLFKTPEHFQYLKSISIENEAANGLKNEIGTIAMARTSDPHSARTQFFINVGNNKSLNHTSPTPRGYGYAVFGRVISGMDIVNKISVTPTGASKPFTKDVPKEMVVIKSISTIESVSEEMKSVK